MVAGFSRWLVGCKPMVAGFAIVRLTEKKHHPPRVRCAQIHRPSAAAALAPGERAGGACVRFPPARAPRPAPASGGFLTVEGGEAEFATTPGPPIPLRYPIWNGTRVWNLHLHSKMLHWWRSDDPAPPTDAEMGGEGGDMS